VKSDEVVGLIQKASPYVRAGGFLWEHRRLAGTLLVLS